MRTDRYHYHEMLDRLHLIVDIIGRHIEEHPVYIKHESLRNLIDCASNTLVNAYQLTGNIEKDENGIKKSN